MHLLLHRPLAGNILLRHVKVILAKLGGNQGQRAAGHESHEALRCYRLTAAADEANFLFFGILKGVDRGRDLLLAGESRLDLAAGSDGPGVVVILPDLTLRKDAPIVVAENQNWIFDVQRVFELIDF